MFAACKPRRNASRLPSDGLEALRLVRSGTVDLVISDVAARHRRQRLTRAIRDEAALGHVSVLLISGDAASAESAADGFLSKPFNTRQLSAALNGLAPRRPGPS